METELEKAWNEAYSLRGDETDLKYIGTVTKDGRDYLFYRDPGGDYWYDSKPAGEENPGWMRRKRRRKSRSA